MERGSANLAFRQIRTLYTLGTLGGLTDAQLLEMFLTRGGDDAEDAFAALVHRHGPMVLGVCRRMLPGSHDAEDSFQATFLILVRRAASIGRRQQLANWLYGVAVRTAKQARRRAARQRARERRLMETSQVEPAPLEDRAELLSLLDEELNRLPRHYRAALVACELEGKARREAALQLGLPEGTLSAHLARGRKLLHKRLVRRGVSLGVGPFAGLPRHIAEITVTERLAGSTVRAALGYLAGGASSGAVPATVAALVEGGLKMMFLTRLALLVATMMAIGIAALTAGVAWSAIPTGPGEPPMAQVAPKAENRPAAGKLSLRAVTAATNEPIEGVSISYRADIDDKFQQANVTTGEDGTATIEWAPGATVHLLWFTASKPNLESIHIRWDDERHPVKLPTEKELRFEPGVTIGGIVQDKAGQPIEGATVAVRAPPTEYEGSNYAFALGKLTTDAQGRWRLDGAPRELAHVWAIVTHPRYRRGGAAISRNLDSVTVLTKGLTVTGRVVDQDGRPIKGARAIIGHDTWGSPGPAKGTTNEQGQFTLENCDTGPTIVTVQAEGFAPQFRDVRVEERTAPVVITLAEPGSLLRLKVVDVQGKPVAGAFFRADTWRTHRSIHFQAKTGPDGRVEWRSAPKDAVLYDIRKSEYMSSRRGALTASEHEQTVILYPKLVISGRVTDAETGRPLPAFRVVQGQRFEKQDRIVWSENAGVDVAGGRYTSQFDEPVAGLFFRVEAPGYKPAQSRAFLPTEGSQILDFALNRGVAISGVVLLPDGEPAAGAEVAVVKEKGNVILQSGRFDRNANFPRVTTGTDGRFTFPPADATFLLVATGDGGYVDALSDEFAKSGKLVLQPWGRIEGGVRIGPRSGSDQEVAFRPMRPEGKGGFHISDFGHMTRTDERGRFRFDRVIPGPGVVARLVVTEYSGGSAQFLACWQEPVEVGPGKTVEVRLGGKGRPVIGRLVLDGIPEAPVDWTQNEPVSMNAVAKATGSPPIGSPRFAWVQFASKIDKDGRFRVEDVPPGQYKLMSKVARPGVNGPGPEIGKATVTVTVPEVPGGRSNEPLDLGTITAHLLKTGDLSPDFDEKRFSVAAKSTRPSRFPVTQFAVANDKQAGNPSVVVLDDCDKDFEEDRPHHDALWIFQKPDGGNQGDVRAVSFKDFNTCQTVGAIHCVAIDAARGRIYLCELVGNRVTALDVRGRKLWQVDKIEANALAVDPKTGNLWCTTGKSLVDGEIVVLDTTGREVMSFPVRGPDIAYDPQSDGFWLVGSEITKLSREGKVLFTKPHGGWACVSVATNPRDGSVWIVERKHQDVAPSVNRLWHLDANGAPIKTWDLGDKRIFGVACDPRTGMAWVVNLRTELLCFTADGEELPAFPVKAVAVAVSPTSGQVWATTETEVIRLDDDGLPAFSSPLGGGAMSGQSWLAAF